MLIVATLLIFNFLKQLTVANPHFPDCTPGRTDFEKQRNILGKMEVRIPEFKSQIQSEQKILSVFDTVIKGITQAEQEMRRKQRFQEQQQQQSKKRKRNRNQQHRYER